MQEIIIVVLVLALIYFHYILYDRNTPIYLDVKVSDICKKIDSPYLDTNRSINTDGGFNDIRPLLYNPSASSALRQCKKDLVTQKKNFIDLWSNQINDNVDLNKLYLDKDDYLLEGSDKLTYRMMDMSKQNKRAMINRAMWNKNSLLPYFEEELNDHANSRWWDDDTLESEF